jgi:hypothetical protein
LHIKEELVTFVSEKKTTKVTFSYGTNAYPLADGMQYLAGILHVARTGH